MTAGKHRLTGLRQSSAAGRSRRVGFTLIELLVVVCVITLLLTITVPAMSAARRLSKRAVCGTNLHSIGQAIQAYLTMHNDTYPSIAGWPPPLEPPFPSSPPVEPPMFKGLKTEVGNSREVFRCPADANIMNDPQCTKPTYWETVGTSYQWETWYNGKRVGRDVLTSGRGLALKPWDAWIVFDYQAFHGGPKRKGSLNVLYADFHVQPDNWQDPASP